MSLLNTEDTLRHVGVPDSDVPSDRVTPGAPVRTIGTAVRSFTCVDALVFLEVSRMGRAVGALSALVDMLRKSVVFIDRSQETIELQWLIGRAVVITSP